jgi:hypothetical protein
MSLRLAWLFAASALVVALGLGGCRAGARNSTGGAQTTQQSQSGAPSGAKTGSTNSGAPGSSNSTTLKQLQTIDNQDQSDSQQLNSAQTSAGVNYISQSSNTIP